MSMRFAAVVLAAGAGSRFGGGKLLARLDGRSLLQHVLDAVVVARPALTVVVLGRDADAIEAQIAWRGEMRVLNPDPSRGLASSLKAGLAALESADPAGDLEAALILLGDQPRVRVSVIGELLVAAAGSDLPIVLPRYTGGGGSHPVLLRRVAWPLAARTEGDRGLGPIIVAHPDLVREVPVAGANPDVDTSADLAALTGE